MDCVGAYEAKTHLPKLLEKVSKGERIIITWHGVPIAVLSPYDNRNRYASSEIIDRLKQFRKDKKLRGLNLKVMIETGRD